MSSDLSRSASFAKDAQAATVLRRLDARWGCEASASARATCTLSDSTREFILRTVASNLKIPSFWFVTASRAWDKRTRRAATLAEADTSDPC